MMDSSQSVLVIAPHPDDETFGCGGTIKHMTRSGVEVDVLYMTRGEFGMLQPDAATPIDRQSLAEIRTAEARAACEILGVSQVRFLNGADGKLHAQPELAAGLRTELARKAYQRVFCPWHNDGHPDHRATYDLLMSVLRRTEARPTVWLYEVWSPLPHTMIVPIDATIEAKQRAMRAHASQLACLDYASAFQGLASYRALFCPPSKFAEGFFDSHLVSRVARTFRMISKGTLMVERLHWGCGVCTRPRWVNSDIAYALGVDVVADIRNGLPLPDDAFEYVVSMHALPELAYPELDQALTELRRVLKPGGVLRLGLPDMAKAIQAFQTNDPDYFLVPDDDVRSLGGKMIVQLLWYGRSRSMFTEDFVEELLVRNGYQKVTICDYQVTHSEHPAIVELDNRPYESLFVEAWK